MDPADGHEAEAWPDGRDAGAEWTRLMDKLVFLFQRKAGLTHDEFADHYLNVHALLGQRLTVTMAGYTVNIVDGGSGDDIDAITEIWTASTADFFDPSKSFATPEDAAELMADHDSFIGPYDAYVVDERIVRGGPPDGPIGARASGVKVVSLHRDAAAVPDPPAGATRVVDEHVLQGITPDAPPLALIRSVWAPDLDALGAFPPRSFVVGEYRRLEPAR
jgi:hypothetical protein